MRAETADRIIQAMVKFQEAMTRGLVAATDRRKLLKARRMFARELKTRVQPLRTKLLQLPEPPPENIKRLEDEILQGCRTMLLEAARVFPHPPGGRPHKLDAEQSKSACLRVDSLIAQGVERRKALERTAQQRGVSLRTMQRTYKHYRVWKLSQKRQRTR